MKYSELAFCRRVPCLLHYPKLLRSCLVILMMIQFLANFTDFLLRGEPLELSTVFKLDFILLADGDLLMSRSLYYARVMLSPFAFESLFTKSNTCLDTSSAVKGLVTSESFFSFLVEESACLSCGLSAIALSTSFAFFLIRTGDPSSVLISKCFGVMYTDDGRFEIGNAALTVEGRLSSFGLKGLKNLL